MAKVSVYNMQGEVIGDVELSSEVFEAAINDHLVHQAVIAQLAAKRQGTQSARTRSEVSGGGIKPWRQKGTGRARQGSIRAPQWTGGGVVFAPKPRDYEMKMNKKEKRAALKSVLTSKVQENKIYVIDAIKCEEIKTKTMANLLGKLELGKALVVLAEVDKNVILSTRNIKDVKSTQVGTLNVFDVLKYDSLVID